MVLALMTVVLASGCDDQPARRPASSRLELPEAEGGELCGHPLFPERAGSRRVYELDSSAGHATLLAVLDSVESHDDRIVAHWRYELSMVGADPVRSTRDVECDPADDTEDFWVS